MSPGQTSGKSSSCSVSVAFFLLNAMLIGLVTTGWVTAAQADSFSWSAPVDLSARGEIIPYYPPIIGLTPDGNKAVAVWAIRSASGYTIQASSAVISSNKAAWSPVVDLDTSEEGFRLQLAFSADGTTALAIWSHVDSSTGTTTAIIKASLADFSGGAAFWGSALALSEAGDVANQPYAALSAEGHTAIVSWQHFHGNNAIIQTRVATINGRAANWSPVTDLSATGESAFDAPVAISENGSLASIVWMRGHVIQSRSAVITGNSASWGTVSDLSGPIDDSWYPRLAISKDGTKATAVWYSRLAIDVVQSSSATISGNTADWSGATTISETSADCNSTALALSHDGTKATVAWERRVSTYWIIQSVSAEIGGNTAVWGATTDFADGLHDEADPQVALSGDGTRGFIIFTRSDGNNRIAMVSRGVINGTSANWGEVSALSAPGKDSSNPHISISTDGQHALAAWERDNLYQASTGATVETPRLADLSVVSVSGPKTWKKGTKKKISVTLRNGGKAAIDSQFVSRLYLYSKRVLNLKKAIRLGDLKTAGLTAGARLKKSLKVLIPRKTAPRKYYLFVVTDATGKVAETSENNNSAMAARKISVTK